MTEEIRLTTEVLSCDYFNRNRGFNCYKGKNCTEVPDCYYRQLKRLEQENKELKIYIESNKQQVEEVEMLVMDNNRLQQDAENLKDIIYYDVEKYRSALEEIRILATKNVSIENFVKIQNKINGVLNDN